MTEIDYLKLKLKDMEKAFDKLHQRHMVLLKEQGELERKNEQLRKYNEQLKERLERINGGYGHLTHRNGLTANEWLIESQERELKKKNEQISNLREENIELKKLKKYCAEWIGVKEENLYDVVR